MYDVKIARTELLELNPKYVSDWNVYTRRHDRYSAYSYTANVTFVQPANNNVTTSVPDPIACLGDVNWHYKRSALVFDYALPFVSQIHITGFEREQNTEYKEGAFVIKKRICDWLQSKNDVILLVVRHHSPTFPEKCPLVGTIFIKDLVITPNFLPPYIPFKDARLEFFAFKTDSKEVLFRANVYVTVVERLKRTKKTQSWT